MTREETILKRVKYHYDAMYEIYGDRLIATFLVGSQNYGLDTDASDVDTKSWILPSEDDIFLGSRVKTREHHLIASRYDPSTNCSIDTEEHAGAYDIRDYFDILKKQNINFTEVLYTDFCVINPRYDKYVNEVIEIADHITNYYPERFINSMRVQGVSLTEPSRKIPLKRLAWAMFVKRAITCYLNGFGYEYMIRPTGPARQEIMEIKRNGLDDETREALHEWFEKLPERITVPKVDEEIQKEVDTTFYNIVKELVKNEVFRLQ